MVHGVIAPVIDTGYQKAVKRYRDLYRLQLISTYLIGKCEFEKNEKRNGAKVYIYIFKYIYISNIYIYLLKYIYI